MKFNKKKGNRISVVFLLIIALIIAAILVCFFIMMSSKPPKDLITGSDPDILKPHESTDTYSDVIVKNIEIDDFDEGGMGILNANKYYQLQYGVHVKERSYIGDLIGTTSLSNTLVQTKGDNVYQYSEGASYLVDDNTKYYNFNGEEDIILADTGTVDTTINGVWVMSPDLLPKTSLYSFIDDPTDINIVYYPDIDDISANYTVDNPSEFIGSLKRITSPPANVVETGYMTIDDNSGLLYGAIVIYDYDTGKSYLNPPSFPNLFFEAETSLESYLKNYYSLPIEDNSFT